MTMAGIDTNAQQLPGIRKSKSVAKIVNLVVMSGTVPEQQANLTLDINDKHETTQGVSKKGPFDAIANAVHTLLGRKAQLLRYKGFSNAEGTDAEGTVKIWVSIDGNQVTSTAKSTDTNLAFARAYLGVFNR